MTRLGLEPSGEELRRLCFYFFLYRNGLSYDYTT